MTKSHRTIVNDSFKLDDGSPAPSLAIRMSARNGGAQIMRDISKAFDDKCEAKNDPDRSERQALGLA